MPATPTISKTRRLWRMTVHLMVGFPVAILTSSLVQAACLVALVLVVTVVGFPYAQSVVFNTARLCTTWQRSRFAELLGIELTPMPKDFQTADARSLAYHLVVGPLIGIFGALLVSGLWVGGLLLVALPWLSRPTFEDGPLEVLPNNAVGASVISVGGLVMIFLAAPVTTAMARLDISAARAMLQPSPVEQLERRVETLTVSRADLVDAADAERRRIERDLHDGAQQRLVSLAMNLGMARANLTDVDEKAREAIAKAHDEAKQALAELRDLVRGLHPAVLDDRGLDAALSGIAAAAPLPVRLHVDVQKRPSHTIEAVAYFVVSEALSNVAKHAHASNVVVAVMRAGDVLHMTITDDGKGGADPSKGTGLRGLAQRVASVDGTIHVDSPLGGPTKISVELPCES